MNREQKAIERFWNRVNKTDSCWLWTGSTRSSGYGILMIKRQNVFAHRFSFFLAHGYMPTKCVLHSCDVRLCVNPAHLREGTIAENNRDAYERGRVRIGSKAPQSKLTEDQVREIKARLKYDNRVHLIGEEYGVSHGTISCIKKGKHGNTFSRAEKDD